MTVVLVHGNPETDALWGPLVDALGRDDVVRLSPPGFGAPLPDDFPATYLAYRDWLEGELAGIDEPTILRPTRCRSSEARHETSSTLRVRRCAEASC